MYGQGCEGGFSYYVSKYANQYELVPDSCNAYTGESNGDCEVCDKSTLNKFYKVDDYYMVGGAYG